MSDKIKKQGLFLVSLISIIANERMIVLVTSFFVFKYHT